jgi:hypothetical protein
MTYADGSAADGRQGPPAPSTARRRNAGTAAIWLGVAGIAVAALLAPFLAGFPSLAVVVLAAVAGLAALLLGIRARRNASGALARWGLILGIVALVLHAVLIGVIAMGALSHQGRADVEIRAQGAPAFSVTYADDSQSYTEDWLGSGQKRFTTKKSSTEITATLPKGAPAATLGCQILWNGTVVADEKSDSGSVTCRYEAH